MVLPSLGHYEDAKQGGTKYSCKVTPAVQIDTKMVERMSVSMILTLICQQKEKEGIVETVRNPTVSPRTVLVDLTVNVTVHNTNAVSYLRNQAAFKKAVQRKHAKLMANTEIFQVLISAINI